MDFQAIKRERACAVCLYQERILMVNIQDNITGRRFWAPPGGGVEEGEEFYLTAERETLEETGQIVRAYPETQLTKVYEFKFQEQIYVTETHFFLVEFIAEDPNFDSSRRENEIFACEWSTLENAFVRMTAYEEIQTAVYELIYPLLRQREGGRTDFIELSGSLLKKSF